MGAGIHQIAPVDSAESRRGIPSRQVSVWLQLDHEIKHDGYRLMARRDPIGIRLITRNRHDWSPRYPGRYCTGEGAAKVVPLRKGAVSGSDRRGQPSAGR